MQQIIFWKTAIMYCRCIDGENGFYQIVWNQFGKTFLVYEKLEDKRKAFEAGMNGHLAKPINMDTVKKTIAEVLADTR